ncbi:lantibiotic dehydratase family protein [Streptomyces somaliensis]|nr:lantibiotic dehydratase family protein [Streptomyces somaliensis]
MAAKTTPRDWAGHVAVVPVGEADGSGALLAGRGVLGGAALGEVENVHLVRAGSGPVDLLDAPPSTLLAPAPLHFTQGGPAGGPPVLRCWVVEPHAPQRLRHVVLRRTGALGRILALFTDGPVALGDVEGALLAPVPGGRSADPAVLRGFLRHLVGTGVLQVCAAPRRRYGAWSPPGAPPPLPAADAGAWFADVYRRADAVVGARAADRVREGCGWPRGSPRCARPRRPAGRSRTGRSGRSRGRSARSSPTCSPPTGTPPPPRAARTPGWAAPGAPGGEPGYAALLDHLAARAGEERVDLDDALLDALGAPPADEALPPWPFDCLLRPLAGGPGSPVAVLETASPAGMLDARFAEGMRALDGGYGAADAYRAFLADLERRTGVRFVELLVPPLAERAANAVRRPVVTSWWTGDPDPTPYHGPVGGEARYLPLDRITVRTRDGRLVAEADGRRIVPVHHATRGPVPPYDRLLRLLLAAGLPPPGGWCGWTAWRRRCPGTPGCRG